jgi:hypothetical protein
MGLSARGVAAMTESERAPRFRILSARKGDGRWRGSLSYRQRPEMLAASAARLHRRALEISFVARRGEHPGVPDRIGLQGVLLGEIDLFTGVERARGNALGLTRGLHAHSAVGREVQVAAGRNSPAGDTPPGVRTQGCSRVRREIPSGRTGRIALSSERSYRIVVCMSRSHGIALLS